VVPEYIYEATRGAQPTKLKIYDSAARREIDREITDRAKDFIVRQVDAGQPFFAYIPYTQTHYPVVAGEAFEGKSGNGKWGDILMQIDAYVGELLDTVEQLGISRDTIFIFTADNGPEMSPGQHGWSGPWRGTYFTATEGSLRVPFLIRWPGKIPAGGVSNEIVHQFDLFTTLARMTGSTVPTDRVIDGVDQSDFFMGETAKSSREAFVVYVGADIFGVKWRNWKMLTKEFEGGSGLGTVKAYGVPRFYNLYDDPQELHPWTGEKQGFFWVRWPMVDVLGAHLKSLALEPPIKPGTADPYLPQRAATNQESHSN
jgi:arylsulfatase